MAFSQPREVARLTNAAARLIDAYQSGCLTLQKLKTKGTQRVVVQHQQVHVGDGGQAVVAGRIEGGRGGEGERKMANEVHEQRRGWLKTRQSPGRLNGGPPLWRPDPPEDAVSVPRHARPAPLSAARGEEHGPDHRHRPSPKSTRPLEARGVLARDA